ncbi:MAG TPA: hypothetical protein VNJ71_13540 [Gemmatimonadales bacterium]|jgi:hypothetical protein|nr:hypothetical protein [Gemmatimonadales bacterium]
MSLEGLIALFVIGFLLDRMSKAARRKAAAERPPEAEPREGFTLEGLLEEVRRMKREAEATVRPPPERSGVSADRWLQLGPPGRRRPARREPPQPTERGPVGRRARAPLPSAEEVEERGSLEAEPEVVSFDEAAGERPGRAVVDLDEAAEEVVRRRIAEAEARDREHRVADHEAFHQKIAQPAAGESPPPRLTPAQLRSALVWREILGPPRGEEL